MALVIRHPGIFQVGNVTDDGTTVVISGWGLALCASGCGCHRHGVTGRLDVPASTPRLVTPAA